MKTQLILGACVVLIAALILLGTDALPSARYTDGSGPAMAENSPGAPPTASRWVGETATLQSAGGVLPREDAAPEPGIKHSMFLRQIRSLLSAAEHEPNPDRREQMLVDLVAWIEARDVGTAVRFISEEEPSELMRDIQGRLLEHWTNKNPEKAANAILEMSGQNRLEALETVLTAWADERASEAIAWMERLPEGEEKQRAYLSVASEAARTEPETALRLAGKLPSSPTRDDLFVHAAAQWSAIDPERAGAWVVEIEDSPLRDRLLAMIATAWGENDPAAAAALALEWLPPGKPQNDAVVGIVQRWTQRDPGSAAAWVGDFQEGVLRNSAMENVVKLWANQDAHAAGEWLNTLPPSLSRNCGLRAYAEQIAPAFPRDAARWAGAITDPEMRTAQMEAIARIWMQSDPIAATGWIWKAPFLPETRKRLLAPDDSSTGKAVFTPEQ